MEKYLTEVKSLKALNTDGSITTRYRNVAEQAKHYPGWRDVLYVPEFRARWGFIFGIDTTSLKIKGREYCYVHAADISGKDHLAYEIMEKEDAASIGHVLRTLRNAGYYPNLVVTDLAPEILSAIKEIFPNSKVQSCLFHLQRWLNKQLPTRKKRIDRKTRQLWESVKKKVMEVVKVENMEIRQRHLTELKNMQLDEASSSVLKMFLENLQYYHTLQELIWFGCKREYMYNNFCERSIGEIKGLKRDMYGFKNLENAQKYIDAFWFLKRKKRAENQTIKITKEETETKLPLFKKTTDLAELSEDTGIKFEVLKVEAEKAGFEVIGNLAFSPEWLQKAREKLEKGNPKTLEDGIKLIGDVPWSTFKLLGFDIKMCSLDPSKILLVPFNKNKELAA
ncbi:MAG: DDE-type integrase/transposase/recombinase [Candidatus Jordarchaeaceae archaeon]